MDRFDPGSHIRDPNCPPPSACPGLRGPPQPLAMAQMLKTEAHILHTEGYSHVFWIVLILNPTSATPTPSPSLASQGFKVPLQSLAMAQMLKTEAHTLHARGYSHDVDLPSPFQMLQILYKSFTKLSILEPQAPHGSSSRSAKSFSNASNPLQILHKTEHFGPSGASWLKQPICQFLLKCFKSFTNPLQN